MQRSLEGCRETGLSRLLPGPKSYAPQQARSPLGKEAARIRWSLSVYTKHRSATLPWVRSHRQNEEQRPGFHRTAVRLNLTPLSIPWPWVP